MENDDYDLTTAYLAGVYSRDDQVQALRELARDLYQALQGNPPAWMNGYDLDNLAAEYPWLNIRGH